MNSRGMVLIVDDDADTRAVLSGYLRNVGYEAWGGADGQQALRMLHEGARPVAIVCDAATPSMGGRVFVEQVRSDRNAAPVLLMTAGRGAGSEGADGAIAKPFQLVDFGDKLLRLLRKPLAR